MLLNPLHKQASWLATLLLISWLALHLAACLMQTGNSMHTMAGAAGEMSGMTTSDHHSSCCDPAPDADPGCEQLDEWLGHTPPQLTVLLVLLFCIPLAGLLYSASRLHFWLCLYPLPIRSTRPPPRLRFCIWRD